tara:strand:+ start:940 stop:1635 length:696 start_codon:yes stop_codon:yes gene_type:complete
MSLASSSQPSSLTECLKNTKNAFKFAQLTFGPTLEAVEGHLKSFTHLQNQIDNLRKEMKKQLQPAKKKKKKPKKEPKKRASSSSSSTTTEEVTEADVPLQPSLDSDGDSGIEHNKHVTILSDDSQSDSSIITKTNKSKSSEVDAQTPLSSPDDSKVESDNVSKKRKHSPFKKCPHCGAKIHCACRTCQYCGKSALKQDKRSKKDRERRERKRQQLSPVKELHFTTGESFLA